MQQIRQLTGLHIADPPGSRPNGSYLGRSRSRSTRHRRDGAPSVAETEATTKWRGKNCRIGGATAVATALGPWRGRRHYEDSCVRDQVEVITSCSRPSFLLSRPSGLLCSAHLVIYALTTS